MCMYLHIEFFPIFAKIRPINVDKRFTRFKVFFSNWRFELKVPFCLKSIDRFSISIIIQRIYPKKSEHMLTSAVKYSIKHINNNSIIKNNKRKKISNKSVCYLIAFEVRSHLHNMKFVVIVNCL